MTAKLASLSLLLDVSYVIFEYRKLWKNLNGADTKNNSNIIWPYPVHNLMTISFSRLPRHGAIGQNIFHNVHIYKAVYGDGCHSWYRSFGIVDNR